MTDKEEDEFRTELLDNNKVLQVTVIDTIIDKVDKMLTSLNYVVLILIIFAAALSFVVMYNLSNINIAERQREIATLKVLGFYNGEVDNYIIRENIILTLLGMVFEDQIGIKLCVTGAIGALALIITGVITEKQALQSIDLKTIFLFGGTLASALSKSGAGELVANKVIGLLGDNPSPYLLTFVVFILCCVLTNFMSNTATTALMVPICVSIANGIGADPSAVLMACVIGGSCAYATPIGMPANTMVITAGGYTFKDYAKAGVPLIIVSTIVSMILLPIFYPFFP